MGSLIQTVQNVFSRHSRAQLKHKLALWCARNIMGQDIHLFNGRHTTVSCYAVFWYKEEGIKKLLMYRRIDDGQRARFANDGDMPASQTLSDAVAVTFGKAFRRSLGDHLFDADRVASAPSFHFKDEISGEINNLQALTWVIQITTQQAQLCNTPDGYEMVIVPEYALMGPDVSPSHKAIFQSCVRHMRSSALGTLGTTSSLDELAQSIGQDSRLLH